MDRSLPETVRRYSLEILHWLLDQGVKAVVVACNTSTAHALRALQEATPVPVIGVIKPGARAVIAAGSGGPVGVIGTAGTIASNAYPRAIEALAPGLKVVQKPCPLFVPLVEEGWFDHEATELGCGGISLLPSAKKAYGGRSGLHPLPAFAAAASADHGSRREADR